MAGIFSVFSIGTSHSQREPNNTIATLGHECHPRKKINDGPGWHTLDLFGKFFGQGMDSRCRSTVTEILTWKPEVVNLAGHSRGAVLCHMIANDLAANNFPGTINMVVLDPVNMSSHTQRAGQLRSKVKLGSYVAIVMENESSSFFPLTDVKPLSRMFEGSISAFNMPGTHGSGTQCLTSPIGAAIKGMIKFLMQWWGSTFDAPAPKPKDLLELFATIHTATHFDNKVKYDSKGLVSERWVTNDTKGMNKPEDFKAQYQKVARQDQVGKMVDPQFRDNAYFFNKFHASCFKVSFPAIYERLAGDKAWWQTKANNPAHLKQLDAEIKEIKGGVYPNLYFSLFDLGMF
ncbi:MAG: hypothetical protein WBL61_25740 [Bryobacteraceae bacterium]